ncbi:MAG TPA: acyl-CoA dehydrogenase family protein [Nevskiaceae bacterium]|nr:acyl-CoA dehydrogenase family protein [Nevskiaceae bacterium]
MLPAPGLPPERGIPFFHVYCETESIMDLEFTQEETAFRDEVRQFLAKELPARLSNKVRGGLHLKREDHLEWHAILRRHGWLAMHWPVEYGGTGWGAAKKFIFEHECSLAGAPEVVGYGLTELGPVIQHYGSEAQKQYWLPRILNDDDWWCQGYSEPGSGSDLASLKTTAVRDGDHYVVNGQKIWTSLAHFANMIFCLVRTNTEVRKQAGISFLLIDLKTPGVEVRPIITLEGAHEVNEVFFTNVRVPAENLVGEQDKGWTYAKFLLTLERNDTAGVGTSEATLARLKQLAAVVRLNDKPLAEDPLFAARVARVEIELENMKTTSLRELASVVGGGRPGVESSMLKIRGTEILQTLTSLGRRAVASAAIPYVKEAFEEGYDGAAIGPAGAATLAAQYFNNRKLSIYSGSNEIQRCIIAKTVLGL